MRSHFPYITKVIALLQHHQCVHEVTPKEYRTSPTLQMRSRSDSEGVSQFYNITNAIALSLHHKCDRTSTTLQMRTTHVGQTSHFPTNPKRNDNLCFNLKEVHKNLRECLIV
jgi:hypothetical protein